jgi:hypothetical protein
MANNIQPDVDVWSATLSANQPDGSDAFKSLPDDLRAIQAGVKAWKNEIDTERDTNITEWRDYGHVPTRTSANTFTVTGNKTGVYTAGRPIKCTDGASTFYGTIASSVYTTLTTVTVTLDSGALTASLSAVATGIDNTNGAIRVGLTPVLGDASTKLATTAFVSATSFSTNLPGQTGSNGKFLKTNGSVASWQVSLPVSTYDNRSVLRSTPGVLDGDLYLIKELGLFAWHSSSTELDDDETCFAATGGRWLLECPYYDFIYAEDLAFKDSWPGKILSVSKLCSITSISSVSQVSFTALVFGASVGDRVIATPPDAMDARISFYARVTATDTVTVYLNNPSASTATIATGTWAISVIKGA